VSDVHFGRSQLDGLIEALLQVRGLTERDARDARVRELTDALRRPFDPDRSDDPREDLSEVVNACATVSGGLRTLARIVQQRHSGEASARFVALTDDVVGPVLLSPHDREALRRILLGISIVQVADAVAVLDNVAELRSLQVWRDIPAAIRVMERIPVPDSGLPPLLRFVDRLASIEDETNAAELHHWLATVSGGLSEVGAPPAHRRGTGPLPAQRVAPGTDGQTRPRRADEPGLIWSGVPIRNRNFTGRVALLDRLADALQTGSTTSVLPQTLQGLGGVGKTQLVIEFVYRHLDQYDLVWWIPAEQTATVLTSLTQLAERLGLPIDENRQETARTVLDALAGSDLAWLLVYDNADEPSTLENLIPSTGGHVVVTTRIPEWSDLGVAIEVDVFKREESIELLRNRSRDDQGAVRISEPDADALADKLGDLPLALEQAAAWYLATAMPIREYIDLLDDHINELLDEGKPANYPLSVAAFVALALDKLRKSEEATAQLFSLFAYLSGEPVRQSLLRNGSNADVSEPLRTILGGSIPTSRVVRNLSRYGLAKVDPTQRVQVHRLVQRVLRDTLTLDQRRETLRNVQNLLAAANPGDPDEQGELDRQREMGPHIEPAMMIHADRAAGRQTVLDHARYLYISGDYENSRYLAQQAATAWEQNDADERLGPDGEQTLQARAQQANATRMLGDSRTAAQITEDTYARFRGSPLLGPEHEYTLITGNQVSHDLRIAGRYADALTFDETNVALHRQVFGPGETYTLRALGNLAVDYRLSGRFADALKLDEEIAGHWKDVVTDNVSSIRAYTNIARDHYGLGNYGKAIAQLEEYRGVQQDLLGPDHGLVLLAERTYAIALRKAGRTDEAAETMRENHARTLKRFKLPNHEFSVAATMSFSNVLREIDELDEALAQVTDAVGRYRSDFGEFHPLTLVGQVNEAITRRTAGDLAAARSIDDRCFEQLSLVLGEDHPYTICAATSLATDRALAGEIKSALELSRMVVSRSRASYGAENSARDGGRHPYVLMREINLSYDLRTAGEEEEAELVYQDALGGMRRALGSDHPEVLAAERGMRIEGDIEPPPT
jgi:tetratricopeptide (TPR) repeat protein/KaiC/GvpD/RAD55 family RecA-like ATPase